jgi:RNA polymerase sigma factor for flagellar operon FliA
MGAFSSQYPADLRKVIEHAKRLMKVLNEIERVGTDRWFFGRAGELRGIVSLAITDWRSGVSDTDAASMAIRSYVDTLHRGAAQKLRCGWVFDCCEEDDVITAVAPGEAGPFTEGDTANTAVTQITNGPTAPAGWVDSPEVLARVQGGFALIERNAPAVARRVGPSVTMDDLRAFGHDGLLDAARAFDEGRGVPFDQWASLRIRSAMMDGVRRWGAIPFRARRRLRGLEVAESTRSAPGEPGHPSDPGTSDSASRWASLAAGPGDMAAPLPDADRLDGLGLNPEDVLAKAQVSSVLREIIAELPDRERALIGDAYFHGRTLDQAAASMGITRSWASRLHARAIETMKRELRKRGSVSTAVGAAARGPRRS